MSMLKGNEDEYVDSARTRIRFVLGCVAGVSAVLLVLLLTFMTNKKPAKEQKVTSGKVNLSAAEDGEIPLSELESDGKRVSDELNFWHMYDEPKDESTVIPTARPAGQDDRVYREDEEDGGGPSEEDEAFGALSENSLSENEAVLSENQVDIRGSISENLFDVNQLSDGAAMFAEVESGIKPNSYLKDAFRMDGQWKDYAPLGKKSSFRGIDVSKYQKTIDWGRVAASGIDFAMLRMGSREGVH